MSPDQNPSAFYHNIYRLLKMDLLYVRKLVTSSLFALFYFLFRAIYSTVQELYWRLRHEKERSNVSAKHGGESVHVQRIVYRHKIDELIQSAGFQDFITLHVGYFSPDYLLQPHVTLYCVNKHYAGFIECDEGIDVTSSKHGSFLRIAQFRLARNFIVVPLSVFHSVASRLGDPKEQLVFLTNTSRCGSTLMTQIFEETGHVMAFSEPDAIYNVMYMRKSLSDLETRAMIRSIMRVVCKNPTPGTTAFAIKVSQPATDVTPYLAEIFPKAKNIFMYRDGLPAVLSITKIIHSCPQTDFLLRLSQSAFCMFVIKLSVKIFGLPIPGHEDMPSEFSDVYVGTHVWAQTINYYLKYRSQGIAMVALKYEDILANPEFAIGKIFEYCEIEFDLAKVMRAFDRDSQENSPISRERLRKFERKTEVSEEDIRRCDRLCQKLGAPRILSSDVIEGTITHENRNGFHKH